MSIKLLLFNFRRVYCIQVCIAKRSCLSDSKLANLAANSNKKRDDSEVICAAAGRLQSQKKSNH